VRVHVHVYLCAFMCVYVRVFVCMHLRVQPDRSHGSRTPFEDVDPHPNDNPNVWSRALVADLSRHAKVSLTDMDSGEAADDRPAKGEPTNRLRGGAGVGVLTKAGLVQGVELGTILRERYMGDGGLVQSADDIVLRCSLTSRTVETLRGVLTGIFPKDAARTFKVDVGKKGKGSAHSDYLNFNTQCCPRLAELYFASNCQSRIFHAHKWFPMYLLPDAIPVRIQYAALACF